jgi:unsaturated rhamnogalacturonyl hydrolase
LTDRSNYVEKSCTAAFATGLLMGIQSLSVQGIPDLAMYLESALAGLQACVGQIGEDGLVANVSKGAGVGCDLDFYKNVPIVLYPYGQSLVIVALGQ